MEFSLINSEPKTKNVIEEIQKFGIKNLNINEKTCLTFIDFDDKNFTGYITRLLYEEKIQLCLSIYERFKYEKSIIIPLSIIQTIMEL